MFGYFVLFQFGFALSYCILYYYYYSYYSLDTCLFSNETGKV